MIRIALVVLAFAVTAACVTNAGDGGDGDGTGSGSGSGSGSGPGSGPGNAISPRAGAWTYGEVTPVSTTCNATTPRGQNGDFGVDQVVAASFRIVPGDGTAPFTCTSNGAEFSCPNRASFFMDYRPGVDAAITIRVTATGTFSDSSHATGRQNATVECTGTQCSVLGPLPCNFAVDFAIRAR
jgi:hypothetical protein